MLRSITNEEFAHLWRAMVLPKEWDGRLGVALSGGPDSVCLLFLLKRLASSLRAPQISTIAFTVDHQLQSDSAGVALSAARYSRSLNIPHHVSTIRWGEPPFPNKPTPGAKVESVARKIRHHLLLDAIKREKLQIICTGHHYDDQIETALMRLNKRSAPYGLAGMRDVRRWGMGDHKSYFDGLGWAGSFGMQCWIARPLLRIRKDRILLTCEENGLSYTIDKTNFQPSFTLRNQIRHDITTMVEGRRSGYRLPLATTSSLGDRDTMLLMQNGPEALSSWVQSHQSHFRTTEREVSSFLSHTLRPSPPSTVFIPDGETSLSSSAKWAIIMRVLRYVSCRPWGCVAAESGRASHSLNAIVSRVFAEYPAAQKRVPFSAGSTVLWVPTSLRPCGSNESSIAVHGWLAQRLPPPAAHRVPTHAGLVTFIREPAPLRQPHVLTSGASIDIGSEQVFHFLFDCRFLVHVDLRLLPGAAKKAPGQLKHITIASVGKFSLPSILLTGNNTEQYYWELPKDPVMPGAALHAGQPWVVVKFARTLSSP